MTERESIVAELVGGPSDGTRLAVSAIQEILIQQPVQQPFWAVASGSPDDRLPAPDRTVYQWVEHADGLGARQPERYRYAGTRSGA